MLGNLHKLARCLYPFRGLFLVFGTGALLSFILVFLTNQAQHYLFVSATILIWSLLFTLLINSFIKLPSPLSAKTSFIARVKYKLHNICLSLLIVICSLAALATFMMTFRLISFGFFA